MKKVVEARFQPGVDPTYHGFAIAVGEWLRDTQKIKHDLLIFVTKDQPGNVMWHGDEEQIGYFVPNHCIIFVQHFYKKFRGLTFHQRLDEFIVTIMHEFCHYEQYRDKKPFGHRNVERRAYSLAQKFRNDFHARCQIVDGRRRGNKV